MNNQFNTTKIGIGGELFKRLSIKAEKEGFGHHELPYYIRLILGKICRINKNDISIRRGTNN